MPPTLISRSALARRWNKSARTIARWQRDKPPGFPTAISMSGYWHFRLTDVEAYEASLVAGSLREAA